MPIATPGHRGRRRGRDPDQVVVDGGDEAVRPRQVTRQDGAVGDRPGAEADVLAVGIEPVLDRLGERRGARDQRQHEAVAALLLLARLLELDLPMRGRDDVHDGVGPLPQRRGERDHAPDVGVLLAGHLTEARPHLPDGHPVGVQHRLDRDALLGPLAADVGGELELGCRGLAHLAQRVERACRVPPHRPSQCRCRHALERRDLGADAVDDARDQHVELCLDLVDQPGDDIDRLMTGRSHPPEATAGRRVMPWPASRATRG